MTVSPLYVSPETIPVICMSFNNGVRLNTFLLKFNWVVDSLNVIDVSLAQPWKAKLPMEETEVGMVTDVRFEQ